jgi:Ca2+-transporting ATPase
MKMYNLYNKTVEEISEQFKTDLNIGLTDEKASDIQKEIGYNELVEKGSKTMFQMIVDQFKNFLILVLLSAAIVSGAVGEIKDAILIVSIVILNAVLGVVQENKAEESLQALKKLASPEAKAIRGGSLVKIPAKELVPGDLILLEAGDNVPADGRLVEVSTLKIEEAALTGESIPVEKNSGVIKESSVPLGDQKNLAFMSSVVVYGRGKMVVTATGMSTQIGKIAEMIQENVSPMTPLQKKLDEIGKILAIMALGICTLMFAIGIFQGRDALEMFMTAVSLAVAAIPEGLPAIVTVVLALGVQRLIKRHAIIRKLPAVETLGSASVICSDKTGTLTQNKMTVRAIYCDLKISDESDIDFEAQSDSLKRLLEIALLCNDGEIKETKDDTKEIGDPTETALVHFAYRFGLVKNEESKRLPRIDEIPFDSDRKLMSTIHEKGEDYLSFTKGAPDVMLERCNRAYIKGKVVELDEESKKGIIDANRMLSEKAYRVLGFAFKEIKKVDEELSSDLLENEMIFVGLMGMIDPPREEAKIAINKCKTAGIRPVMITGDHKITAMAIAKDLGIIDDKKQALSGSELDMLTEDELSENIETYSVYARVSPEHKVRIVEAWQKKGHVVAMTGDGVNDAPALKKADIGCAMGITGTDVAKEASEMIMTDDNFATIVSAVEEGRVIYANIRKAVHFLLSCNIGEIIALFTAILLNWAQPLLPVHILWVNLITDSLPALALGLDPKDKNIMNKKPRPSTESVFSDGYGFRIIYQGFIIGAVTLGAFKIGFDNYGVEAARTIAFGVLGLAQISHSFNVKAGKHSVFAVSPFGNKYLIFAGLFIVALQVIVLSVPFIQEIFDVVSLNGTQWLIIIGFSIMPLIAVEIIKAIRKLIRGN